MTISVMTQRDKILAFSRRWREQYPDDSYKFWDGRSVGETFKKIAALDLLTCSEADVDAAVGTSGWGSITCDECGESAETLVRLGDDRDYDTRYVDACGRCLQLALGKAATNGQG